jgi:hypothetical protein
MEPGSSDVSCAVRPGSSIIGSVPPLQKLGPAVSDVTNDRCFLEVDKGISLNICLGEEAAGHLIGSFPKAAINPVTGLPGSNGLYSGDN